MKEQEKIIRYWHAVELLQPQSAPKIVKTSSKYGPFVEDTVSSKMILPWEPGSSLSKKKIEAERKWRHTLYAHLYDASLVDNALGELYGVDGQYSEPSYRSSALFAARFTQSGNLVEDSFVLSTEAWFVGRAKAGRDWSRGFEDDQRKASEQAIQQLDGQVSGVALRDYTRWLIQFLGLNDFFANAHEQIFRFKSEAFKTDTPSTEETPLNSNILEDLANVADNIGKGATSEALSQYLRIHDVEQRLRLDDEASTPSVIKRLLPRLYADSCWPSPNHLGLVHSQQLAVNTVLSELRNGTGLLGINGPPGTGKTTLLRDLIASIVTSRADVLAKFDCASAAFGGEKKEQYSNSGKIRYAHPLVEALHGFEIVVASSNNGAVENVTLELPQRNTIHETWLPDAEHFAGLGELVTGKPAWGLISGALGRKDLRRKFVEDYFYWRKPSQDREPADSTSSGKPGNDKEAAIAQSEGIDTQDASAGQKDSVQEQREAVEGLLTWLNEKAEAHKARSSDELKALWSQAVDEYREAKNAVDSLCRAADCISVQIDELESTKKKNESLRKSVQELQLDLDNTRNEQTKLYEKKLGPANKMFKRAQDALSEHETTVPTFWANVLSLWGASRAWRRKATTLRDHLDHARSEFKLCSSAAEQLMGQIKRLEGELKEKEDELKQRESEEEAVRKNAIDLATKHGVVHIQHWLTGDYIEHREKIELAEPWKIVGWREARARLFIKALKLHRTFLELEPMRMRANLNLINAMLRGTPLVGLTPKAIRSAWVSLFMVVPVLSSTFSSFARTFGSVGAGEIGWLLVDEAGQAPPQAAVGALWRSRRALFVGDPLQLKPIINVSDSVLEHMRKHYSLDSHWLPNRQSAQTLADQATRWGREAGPADSKIWVGLPLVVHRRCDKPMQELANRIAYGGAMVYGTATPSVGNETPARLPTGWIHVSGESDGNWVPAEGEALMSLLAMLKTDGVRPEDIAVITPFKAVKDKLSGKIGKMVVGTIHTMQGKEAQVVIMVLGGNANGSGARDWVVSEPNLLNVAATRAKRRFYVIGDINDWKNRALFRDVMDLLPPQPLTKPEAALLV